MVLPKARAELQIEILVVRLVVALDKTELTAGIDAPSRVDVLFVRTVESADRKSSIGSAITVELQYKANACTAQIEINELTRFICSYGLVEAGQITPNT